MNIEMIKNKIFNNYQEQFSLTPNVTTNFMPNTTNSHKSSFFQQGSPPHRPTNNQLSSTASQQSISLPKDRSKSKKKYINVMSNPSTKDLFLIKMQNITLPQNTKRSSHLGKDTSRKQVQANRSSQKRKIKLFSNRNQNENGQDSCFLKEKIKQMNDTVYTEVNEDNIMPILYTKKESTKQSSSNYHKSHLFSQKITHSNNINQDNESEIDKFSLHFRSTKDELDTSLSYNHIQPLKNNIYTQITQQSYEYTERNNQPSTYPSYQLQTPIRKYEETTCRSKTQRSVIEDNLYKGLSQQFKDDKIPYIQLKRTISPNKSAYLVQDPKGITLKPYGLNLKVMSKHLIKQSPSPLKNSLYIHQRMKTEQKDHGRRCTQPKKNEKPLHPPISFFYNHNPSPISHQTPTNTHHSRNQLQNRISKKLEQLSERTNSIVRMYSKQSKDCSSPQNKKILHVHSSHLSNSKNGCDGSKQQSQSLIKQKIKVNLKNKENVNEVVSSNLRSLILNRIYS